MNTLRSAIFFSFAAILVSCTSLGGNYSSGEGPSKRELTWGPVALLGDLKVAEYELENGQFKMSFKKLDTQNPSKNLTEIVKKYLYWEGIKYMIGTLADLDKLRVQAAHSEKLREFDLAAEQQGFTHELNMLKETPIEPLP